MFPTKNSSHLQILSVILLSFANYCNSQNLTAIQANATLPSPMYGTAVHYDGSDSIYIFGGYDGITFSNAILKYAISSDTMQQIEAQLPIEMCCGTVSDDAAGNIYYFGGYGSAEIFKFSPTNVTVEAVGSLPAPNFDSAAVKVDSFSDSVYILAGYDDPTAVIEFQAGNNSAIRIANISRNYNSMTAASDGEGNAYIFGNPPYLEVGPELSTVCKINLSTLQMTFGPETTFPTMRSRPSAVWGGGYAYIIGGYEANKEFGIRSDSIIKFDPANMRHKIVEVVNFPANSSDVFFSDTSSVYVESLNRIYFFGGYTFLPESGLYHDEIWYIDL